MIDLDRLIYSAFRYLFRYLLVAFFDFRAFGAGQVPQQGGVVLASNHQSFFDPILIGLPLRRRIRCAARDSLFRNPIIGLALRAVGGTPISRESFGAEDLKNLVQIVEEGGALVVFPEGTRTRDGERGTPRRGFALVAERARAPVVPVLIEGAHEAWPRHRQLFRRHRLRVVFGEAIHPPAAGEAEGLVERVSSAWAEMEARLRVMHSS